MDLKNSEDVIFKSTVEDYENESSVGVVGYKTGSAIFLEIEGHSTVTADDDDSVVMVDFFDGVITIKVWSDINQEDYTHSIDISKAKKENRESE